MNVPKYMRAFNFAWEAGYRQGVLDGRYKAYDYARKKRKISKPSHSGSNLVE